MIWWSEIVLASAKCTANYAMQTPIAQTPAQNGTLRDPWYVLTHTRRRMFLAARLLMWVRRAKAIH